VAPDESAYYAPGRLLLQSLECWTSGPYEFRGRFLPRLYLFLPALHECKGQHHEERKEGDGALADAQRRLGVECVRAFLAKAGIVACDDGKVIL
jgi:hypothetical protein